MTWGSGRNVTHVICAAVKIPAVWGTIDLTSCYRGAEAGGGRQECDTDNSWGSLSLSHTSSLSPSHIMLPSLTFPICTCSFSVPFCLSSHFLLPSFYFCLQALTLTLALSPSSLAPSSNLFLFFLHLSHSLPSSPLTILSVHLVSRLISPLFP